MRDGLIKLEQAAVKIEGVGIFLTLFIMIFSLTSQIIARLGLPFDLDWTEEVSRLGLIWLISFGAAHATYRGEHFLVEFLLNALSASTKTALLFFIRLLTLIFAATMTWLGIKSTLINWGQIFPVLEIPVGLGYLAVAFGFGLMTLHVAVGIFTGRVVKISSENTNFGTGAD